MSNNALTFTNSVICYKEQIDKEDNSRRVWKERFGKRFAEGNMDWRPVEPFEQSGASNAKAEFPPSIPVSAIANPPLYKDSVGNDALAGGTPHRFGGKWDGEEDHCRLTRAHARIQCVWKTIFPLSNRLAHLKNLEKR